MDGRSHCPPCPCLKVAKVSPPIPVKRKRKRKGKRWRRRNDIWNEAEFRNQILVEKRILYEEGIEEKFSKFPSRVLMFLKVFHRTFYKFSSDFVLKVSRLKFQLETWVLTKFCVWSLSEFHICFPFSDYTENAAKISCRNLKNIEKTVKSTWSAVSGLCPQTMIIFSKTWR